MNESLCIWQAVRDKGLNAWIGNFIFLDFSLGLEQYMPILLLTDQVSLIEWIGLDFNRFHTSEFHSEFSELINLIRVVGQ